MAAAFLWIVLGALVAAIAKLVAWDEAPVSYFAVGLTGIAGAVGGGYLRQVLIASSITPGFDLLSMLFAIVGAALFLFVLSVSYVRRRQQDIRTYTVRRAA